MINIYLNAEIVHRRKVKSRIFWSYSYRNEFKCRRTARRYSALFLFLPLLLMAVVLETGRFDAVRGPGDTTYFSCVLAEEGDSCLVDSDTVEIKNLVDSRFAPLRLLTRSSIGGIAPGGRSCQPACLWPHHPNRARHRLHLLRARDGVGHERRLILLLLLLLLLLLPSSWLLPTMMKTTTRRRRRRRRVKRSAPSFLLQDRRSEF